MSEGRRTCRSRPFTEGQYVYLEVADTGAGMSAETRARGFEVRMAADGREAVEVFRAMGDRIRLVLLDMTMPHLDGEETFRELRRLGGDIQVILMSGDNEQTATSHA